MLLPGPPPVPPRVGVPAGLQVGHQVLVGRARGQHGEEGAHGPILTPDRKAVAGDVGDPAGPVSGRGAHRAVTGSTFGALVAWSTVLPVARTVYQSVSGAGGWGRWAALVDSGRNG
ncbi:hypothetical protein GCM10009583_29890 [Ornithinicoccus hortensis]